MSKKIVIFLIILVIAVGGLFYWLMQPVVIEQGGPVKLFQDSEPPTLFSKDDYQIEERSDGKYIVVEKVGLTCKVPEGWTIEVEGTDKYWINLSSPDAEVFDILTKGCGISVMAGIAKEQVEEIQNNIDLLQKNPEKSDEIREGYEFEVIGINNYEALKWLSPEKQIFGQATGVDIPIGNEKLMGFDAQFPPGYKEKCSLIWEEFLESIIIK